MDLSGAPSQHSGAGMQQHLHQAEHAGVVQFDAGDFRRATRDGQRQAWNRGKSTCTSSAWASNATKRSVTAPRIRRTLSRLSSPLLRAKSLRLLLNASSRRKVENFVHP